MPEKTYTEAEISALLGRAAHLQAAHGLQRPEALTLEEIKTAASEAGIDPRFVELATATASDHEQARWGVPTGVGRTLVVRQSLTENDWGQMVTAFSRELGGAGQVETQDGRRSWSRGPLRITADGADGQTVLHAESRWDGELEFPIALTLVGAIAAATTSALALVSLEWTIGVVAALLAATVVGSFAIYRRRTAVRQERLRSTFESVLDRCAAILHAEAPAPGLERAGAPDATERIGPPDAEATNEPGIRPASSGRLRSGP